MRPCRLMRASISSGGTRTLSPRRNPASIVRSHDDSAGDGNRIVASSFPGRIVATQPSCPPKKSKPNRRAALSTLSASRPREIGTAIARDAATAWRTIPGPTAHRRHFPRSDARTEAFCVNVLCSRGHPIRPKMRASHLGATRWCRICQRRVMIRHGRRKMKGFPIPRACCSGNSPIMSGSAPKGVISLPSSP